MKTHPSLVRALPTIIVVHVLSALLATIPAAIAVEELWFPAPDFATLVHQALELERHPWMLLGACIFAVLVWLALAPSLHMAMLAALASRDSVKDNILRGFHFTLPAWISGIQKAVIDGCFALVLGLLGALAFFAISPMHPRPRDLLIILLGLIGLAVFELTTVARDLARARSLSHRAPASRSFTDIRTVLRTAPHHLAYMTIGWGLALTTLALAWRWDGPGWGKAIGILVLTQLGTFARSLARAAWLKRTLSIALVEGETAPVALPPIPMPEDVLAPENFTSLEETETETETEALLVLPALKGML